MSKIFKNRCFLYEIRYNNTSNYFTNNNSDIIYDGAIYKAEFIKHSDIISSVDISKNEVDINISLDFDIVDDFINDSIRDSIDLTIIESYKTKDEVIKYDFMYKGEITDLLIDGFDVTLKSKFLSNKFKRVANRFKYQSVCNNQLFDYNCTLKSSDFSYQATVVDVTMGGTKIVVDIDDFIGDKQWFVNGKATSNVNNNSIMIIKVNELNELTLLNTFNVKIGDSLRLYIGCNKTYEDCKDRFNNTNNMIAEGSIPKKNPWTSLN